MKRIAKIVFTMLTVLLIPSGIILAQDKKNEQRIKIVVADKSGTQVEIDTLIKGDNSPDSIKLKNGSIIYLAKHPGTRTVKHVIEGDGSNVVSWSSSSGNSNGKSYVIIADEKGTGKSVSKTYSVKVSDNEEDNNVDKTKYVIARDGMVISVEGSDEAKVKDMVKDIESKLGITKEDKDVKKVVKEESKKSNKK